MMYNYKTWRDTVRIKLEETSIYYLSKMNWFIRMQNIPQVPNISRKILKIWYRWHVARNIFAYEMHQINYLVRCKREIYWHGFRHFEFVCIKNIIWCPAGKCKLNSDIIHSRVYEEFYFTFFLYNNIVVRLSHGVHLLSEM